MPPVSAHDVAAELRRQLPGIAVKKLHKLLYYCQGHHLAHSGSPLFAEPIMAWDMGPVVANLWKAEKANLPTTEPRPLDNGQLNTIGYVISRYGRLTGHDLELLTYAEAPWQQANIGRRTGETVRISPESIQQFFTSDGGPDADLPWQALEDLARLAAGAEARRSSPRDIDDLTELRRRLAPR